MINRNKHSFMKKIGTFSLILLLTFTSFGCEALRKKFTRKKKKVDKSKELIPVFEPIDYARKEYSAEDAYKKAYSLWQVWSKELVTVIPRDSNDKNQRYLVAQIINQVTAMRDLLNEEKSSEIQKTLNKYMDIQNIYKKPESMRQRSIMTNKLRQANKELRLTFHPEQVFDYLK